MKKEYLRLYSMLFTFSFLLLSCSETNPVISSFVDDYSPVLTEPSGVAHQGNFYPLAEGNTWCYMGTESSTNRMVMDVNGEHTDTTMYSNTLLLDTSRVLAAIQLQLPSGTYSVFPVVEKLTAPDSLSFSGERFLESTTRYLENGVDRIYARAIKNIDTIYECKDPDLLMKTFIVGDSWESSPTMDTKAMLAEALGDVPHTSTMSSQSKMYVIGKEAVNYLGNMVEAVRVDQRAQINATVNVQDSSSPGTMNIVVRVTVKSDYLNNIGIVKQVSELEMDMDVSAVEDGQTVKVKMNTKSNKEFSLISFYTAGAPLAKAKNIPGTPTKRPHQIKKPFSYQRFISDIEIISRTEGLLF